MFWNMMYGSSRDCRNDNKRIPEKKRFTTNNNVRLEEGIPFPRDIDEANNRILTAIIMDQEIMDAVKQLLLLKLLVQMVCGVSFTKNIGLLLENRFDMVRAFVYSENMLKE